MLAALPAGTYRRREPNLEPVTLDFGQVVWLLLVRDRVPTDELLLRQDFLSDMLGTGRTAVTVAAGALRSEGLIRYSRGRITVLDRPGLEAAACECYATIRAVFDASRQN